MCETNRSEAGEGFGSKPNACFAAELQLVGSVFWMRAGKMTFRSRLGLWVWQTISRTFILQLRLMADFIIVSLCGDTMGFDPQNNCLIDPPRCAVYTFCRQSAMEQCKTHLFAMTNKKFVITFVSLQMLALSHDHRIAHPYKRQDISRNRLQHGK